MVDLAADGVDVRPLRQVTDESDFNEVFFDDVAVADDQLIGGEHDGWRVAGSTLGTERGTNPRQLVIHLQLIEELWREAEDWGLADDPRIGPRLAQAFVEIRLFQLQNWRALSTLEHGRDHGAATATAKLAWSECRPPEGEAPSGFHIYPDMGFVEVVDPASGERVPEGQPGEIVFTQLDARGSIVLRYRTGDLIEHGISHAPCPHCGRTCPRLLGRISRICDVHHLKLDKLKGTLVDFNQLEHLIDRAALGIVQGDAQVIPLHEFADLVAD